ncbi:hypothetical protein L227DRAFT_567927 [Lentinus tigrinus ALCF2SS1-6]|uniref:Uncharacterized protein n=1 Tax=Lentinus tigrinus ALCF2SS1-6 TaxID=1328759 RepID=A0A5C2RQ58_9APHY|nr:hypothetical protein L227DRAFT_567927 [Lentinus tigrinus ALCF2SS1-6]
MPTVTLEDCMIITDPVFMNTTSSFRTNDDCVYCELYRDSFCIIDIATIYAGSAVGDGGESSKGANFNDKGNPTVDGAKLSVVIRSEGRENYCWDRMNRVEIMTMTGMAAALGLKGVQRTRSSEWIEGRLET